MRSAWVYRCLDSEGSALYVGHTTHLATRLAQHERGASWWAEVASVTLERHDCAASAHRAEADMIYGEQPSYNTRHRVRRFEATEPWASLTTARIAAGISMTQLAAAAGTTCGWLSRLESGQREPSVPLVKRLATALGVPLSTIEKNRHDEAAA